MSRPATLSDTGHLAAAEAAAEAADVATLVALAPPPADWHPGKLAEVRRLVLPLVQTEGGDHDA
jgi:hypothetical protein